MVLTPPPLPTRFPCWVRAVYSWGGESKRDLGFIEGDLIECLNAGDGSWWTGRLWRDRRAIGLFPSNFVEVLPDSFRPTSRSTSPLAPSNTPSPKSTPQKSKTFRRPFEAYAKAPHYTTAKTPETYKEQPIRPRDTSANSVQDVAPLAFERAPSRVERAASRIEQAPSPAPPRARSPGPPQAAPSHISRAPSPAPSYKPYRPPVTRQGSFRQSLEKADSPPPPPPPPHRHTAPRHRPNASYEHNTPTRHGSNLSYDERFSRSMGRHNSNASYENVAARHTPNPSYENIPRHNPSASYDNVAARHNPNPSYENIPRHNVNASYESIPRHSSNASYDNVGARHNSNASYENVAARHNSNASYDHRPDGYHTPRMPSPCPPSPGIDNMTPSPLRDAMDDVMEQLDALGAHQDATAPEATFDPWSPESFDMVQHQSRGRVDQLRPQTSMGIAQQIDEGYETHSGSGASHKDPPFRTSFQERDRPPPQLSNYVERMESRLRTMHQHNSNTVELDEAPTPPPKNPIYDRPKSSMGIQSQPDQRLRHKQSAYDMSRQAIGRTFTTKTNSTNASASTQSTDRSLMSGVSAGGISATSAGSLARKTRSRAQSALGLRGELGLDRPETPFTGVTYHSSHASGDARSKSQMALHDDPIAGLGGGGLVQPKPKKQNFIKRMLESAKTGVASSRGSIATAGASSLNPSPMSRSIPSAIGSMPRSSSPSKTGRDTTRDMGAGNGVDWVQVRRDVNRSNSISRNERIERTERCQMLDYPALDPVDELYNSIEGDEGADGMAVPNPTNYQVINLSQVDKNSRFLASLPPTTTAITLATTYVCRPYRSDVQRLRSIFTWVAEKICWEDDFEGHVDTRRVLQTKRGCAEEYAVLVLEMCNAVGLPCEVVRGYLKSPGEIPDSNIVPRSNHWWNAVLVDNEWRMMDCCLASPSNPRRGLYSSFNSSTADPWWFLTRPSETCWTHIPEHYSQQHMCPPVAHEVLLNLPCACPPYFKNGLELFEYNTSLTRIEDLEMVHIKFNVPPDVEVAAEVEVRAYSRDSDGDLFESGDVVKKRALAQAEWFGGVKRYTVKALLPGDEGTGTLKVYAGKRGLMHSIKDIPHPLAFTLPIIHVGENPPYEFVTRHPTPHAQRHDIYVVQPQCQRLALNNTFVFAVRQHPSSGVISMSPMSPDFRATSPLPFVRPSSAMSMTNSSVAGSNPSMSSNGTTSSGSKKPAKLAIQTPGGKILRLMRKEERRAVGVGVGNFGRAAVVAGEDETAGDGGTWETIIKCSERGVWRGLVLADRTARWCVFAEWVCEG
ncbi:hypothetical protein B0T22DRAFT_428142 [Podospora appendiculata]|uniref:SH3 domain-containing protein n=1 Tax=Podospora appendiculata TaxID=314037 RepID=A0AAE1C9U9_9PEZI|nr:hypothetical protein B0T22DRAFT_428142 [Podospora appendiculata]